MKAAIVPIIHDSERLLREVVVSAAKMPKDYKFVVGTKLRDDAIASLLLAQKAFRLAGKSAAAGRALDELATANDGIKALLQVAFDVGALGSAGRLKELMDLARSVGRQCGGWANDFKGNPNGQSSSPSSAPERAGTLSTRDASTGGSMKTNPRYQSDAGSGQKITRERGPRATSGL